MHHAVRQLDNYYNRYLSIYLRKIIPPTVTTILQEPSTLSYQSSRITFTSLDMMLKNKKFNL